MLNYQKTENDCWLCTLKNLLYFVGKKITSEEIQVIILEKYQLAFNYERAFFTYLPIVLDHLKVQCEFVLDSNNNLLIPILEKTNTVKFSIENLEELMDKYYENKNALYYFYKSLKIVYESSYIDLTLDFSVSDFLNKDYIVAAGLTISQLYGIKQNNTFHSVVILKEKNSFKLIDPYKKIGQNQERNWNIYEEYEKNLDWSVKIPYFIAVKRK